MRKAVELVLALCLLPRMAASQSFSSSARGTTAGSFLGLGVGGRAMGLGGAYTAAADDASALYWNPAGLADVEHHAALFMHAAYLASSFYDYAAYARNLKSRRGLRRERPVSQRGLDRADRREFQPDRDLHAQ